MDGVILSTDAIDYPYLWDGSYKTSIKHLSKFDECKQFVDLINSKYRLKVKFSKINANIFVNDKMIVGRKKKNSHVLFGAGVKCLYGTPLSIGGSNAYPNPSFKEGYCIVEFICNGFPSFTSYSHQYEVEVLEFNKVLQ